MTSPTTSAVPTAQPPDAWVTAHHPATLAVRRQRAANVQLRVADAITAFAGSMTFVYIHAVIFAIWCGTGLFGKDKYPFNFLTMTVSLEAIFLSTFVMIGQNRQSEFAQKKADHDFMQEEQELHLNTEVTQAIHDLVRAIHERVLAADAEQLAAVCRALPDLVMPDGPATAAPANGPVADPTQPAHPADPSS